MLSRGNYRKELFLKLKTGEAFERCLFEAVDRCGWKLHAYVIMSNHFHLVLETPELKEEGDPRQRDKLAKQYCRGWFIGEKAKIARELRAGTTAGNIWIAKRLHMGHPSRITNLIRNA